MKHKIIIKKHNEVLEIGSSWKDLTIGVSVRPEDRDDGIRKVKNSLSALETYGDKIVIERDSNEHPNRPLYNWLRRLLRLNKPGFGYRVIDVRKIPKSFDKESAVARLDYEIQDETT